MFTMVTLNQQIVQLLDLPSSASLLWSDIKMPPQTLGIEQ